MRARPDFAPETLWDAEKGDFKPEASQHFRDLAARDAAEASRKLTLPQKPEDYKLTLSPAFKPPQGVEFTPNENDPVVPMARAFAQKHGLTQEAFSELVDLHAAGQVGTQQNIANAKTAELAKLGAAGPARMEATATWLKAQVGEELGKEFVRFLLTSNQVLAVEKLMTNFRTQGVGPYSTTGREAAPANGKIEGYDGMTFEQKRQAQDRARAAPAR